MERILIVLLPLVTLGSFVTRNIIVKWQTRQRIKSVDSTSTDSILLAMLCMVVAIGSTYSQSFYKTMVPIIFLAKPIIAQAGFLMFAVSIVFGWIASGQLRKSWRVGVHLDQTNELIKSGVYGYIRNPFFLACFFILFSLFLIRPSVVLTLLELITICNFHQMVLVEEDYLMSLHSEQYEKYMESTGRYTPIIR